MAECFCGCGGKVGGFMNARKSANGIGQMSQQLVEQIHELPASKGANEAAIDFVGKRLAAVEAAVIVCREVVHEERDFGAVNWPSIRAQVKDVQGMVGYMNLSPEQRSRIT